MPQAGWKSWVRWPPPVPHLNRKRPLPSAFRGRVVAHRGLHLVGSPPPPENSLAALAAAARLGLPVELDVRLTADGEPIVFHDPDAERMTGAPRRVDRSTLSELGRLRLRGADRTTEERIPTLREVLGEVDVPIVLELKQEETDDRGLAAQAIRVLRAAGRADDSVIVESFNPFVLGRVARLAPALHRAQLTGSFRGSDLHPIKKVLLRYLLMNGYSRPDSVAVELGLLDPLTVAGIRRIYGYEVLAWTAETVAGVKRLFERGVACVIADLDEELVDYSLGRTPGL